ncbi:guanine nucleotide exchange protein for ADP-robosylation factor [Apophysomyces sp. BC1034]|nr:guanine nucleotide exchange protein for ADP-robosylation factor [Apophysomyces sp. BC1034]
MPRVIQLLAGTLLCLTVILDMLKNDEEPPEGKTRSTVILTALQMAIDSRSTNLMTISLDCLGKFITYNYLEDMEDEVAQTQVMEKVVDSICDCFIGEETDEKVQLQIIKALLDAVYSTSNPLHLSALLKAVRTTYNIFLLSRNSANQNVAQVTLTQMVDHVFRRISIQPQNASRSTTSLNDGLSNSSTSKTQATSVEETAKQEGMEKEEDKEEDDDEYQQQIIVEANMARSEMDQKLPSGKAQDNSEDFLNDTATMFQNENISIAEDGKKMGESNAQAEPQIRGRYSGLSKEATAGDSEGDTLSEGRQSFDNSDMRATSYETEADLYIKDAILVFRALCKLSKKQISSEWGNDMRSYSMRSKLLSLHLILTILTSHMNVFSSPYVMFSVPMNDVKQENQMNPFILEVKQYLCPSLAKNAFSMVPQVYETTLEILWKVIQGLRVFLKKEIEVFLKEIFLRILEMRNASFQQKHSFLRVVLRICSDSQTLVDIYLNYDCDRQALDNIYERLVNVLSKITTSHMALHNNNKGHEIHALANSDSPTHHGLHDSTLMIPPPLTTAMVQSNDKHNNLGANIPESAIKYKSLECLVAVLQSLVSWYTNNSVSVPAVSRSSVETPRTSEDQRQSTDMLTSHSNSSTQRLSPTTSSINVNGATNGTSTPRLDDPEQFENKKHRKQLLQEGIRQFNWKPKKGLNILIKNGLVNPNDPAEIARFLLRTDGLSKTMIGEFLGEGEPENITIMHAFVDELDFTDMLFVDALRQFLQSFRLPGESQKIDRFMLKFAERYVHGNPTMFANAETAYVLAYAVIMLNTDMYNPQVKQHMTLSDFMKNCRGIDDKGDIPAEVLTGIFDEIQRNEIKMKEEVEAAENAALAAPYGNAGALGMIGLQNALVNAGITRDVRREAYQAATEELGSKTEAMFRNMLASRRRAGETETITFYVASHVEHVRPMFEIAWMSFLTGISGPLQESDDLDTVQLCLNGFKHAIRIICLFHTVQSEDMDLQRNAFVTTLTNFTFLTNLNEMKPKNVEAIKTLLEIAAADGNYLKGSWKEILSTVSQLERFQLITSGIDQGALPDISAIRHAKAMSKPSVEIGRRSTVSRPTRTATQLALAEEVASAGSSQSLELAADRMFTATVNFNGDAIVDFVRALCETSWEEIMSSAHLEHPRMYSLQKLVEISYYNMNRIRMEWSNIWAILGEHYNKVGCQSNFNVSFFALDSLRQLAMQFLAKEELPHFKFQKDFLMPFRDILAINPAIAIKEMVLRCLSQMILARAHHIRSGWKTMLAVFASGAQETTESIVQMTFKIVCNISNERFADIIANGTFPDYISCLVEFSKNKKFQKISLPALDMIYDTIPKMLEIADKDKTIEINDAHAAVTSGQTVQSGDDFLVKFWFAVLFGLKEVTMQSDDVEVRKRALQYLFDTLKKYGSSYAPEFWTTVSRQIVFPLFDDLKSNSRHQRTMSPEDLSVWLSTTMIEALRNVVDLYTFYFDNMRGMMRHVLGLFGVCITQDNDTLARIGCECLEQYIETNVEKFDSGCWDLVTETFVNLFENTTARGLFDDTEDLVEKMKTMSGESNSTDMLNAETTNGFHVEISEDRQRSFQQVIVKCVLQLMLIQTINELLSKDTVYCAFPATHLMGLMECLEKSFHFAKRFNMDNDLRMALWRFGFMKQLPNLLKQETSSGGCYVSVLMRMYANLENISDRDDKREEIENTLIPLCNEIFTLYTELDHETKPKNIAAWTPVVVSILNGLAQLQDEDFLRYVPRFYVPAVELLGQDNLLPEIRIALRSLLIRIGKTYKIGLE